MTRLALAVCVLALAACGGKENLRQPAELQTIAAPAVKLDTVWTQSGGESEYHANLRLVLEPDALFSADEDGQVQALDPKTGKKVWSVGTKARVISGPSVSGDLIFVGTRDAEVIALKRAGGAEAWRAKLSSEVLAPVASDGQIVVARSVDGRLHGLSVADGQRRWVFDRSVPNLTLRGLSEPLIAGGLIFAGMDNGRLVALSPENGQPVWEQAVAVPSGRTELDRITDVDAALLADGSNICAVSFGGELACFDADSGEPQWRRSVKSYSGMALVNNLLVVSDDAGVVWALDARSGAAAWKQEGLQYRQLSAPVAFAGYAVVADFQGYLHWLDAKDGKLVARTRAGSDPIRAPMVGSEDLLYVLGTGGKISAVSGTVTAQP